MSNFQKMNIMKKLLFLLLSVFTLQVAQADNDKPITFDKLPAKAQTFIKQNFPTEKVAFTKMEKGFLDTSYDVVFVNGNGVEFDKNGEWTELDCKRSSVPTNPLPTSPAMPASPARRATMRAPTLGISRSPSAAATATSRLPGRS